MELAEKNKNCIENSDFDLYSFDIFDTLVTRKVATPKGIFAIMQDEINKNENYKTLPENIKENFYLIRVNIEQYLKANLRIRGINEITLEEIYDFMGSNYVLSNADKKALFQLELQTEIQNLVAIPQNINKLKSLINAGKRVILISDMYLTSKKLKFVLEHIDEVFKTITIYSSADHGESKQGTKLYEIVKEKENVEYRKWAHFGDNTTADIKNACRLGINAKKYDFPCLKDYERKVLEKRDDNAFYQRIIGISKIARVFSADKNEKFQLGLSLAAPMLLPYISWVLEQSSRLNIDRLYFIARDGFVLKEIADRIISRLNLNISTTYVYGSREAWRLPSLDKENFDIVNYVFDEKCFLKDIKGIAERLSITNDELIKFLPNKYKNYKKNLSDKNAQAIQTALMGSNEFLELILNKNELRKKGLLAYINKTFDFKDDNFALVDLQGSGITQKCLSSLINTFYKKPIKCFYSRLTPSKPTVNDEFVNIFVEFPNKDYIHFIRELFCRALHGQTIDYKIVNNDVVPVFRGDAHSLKEWGYQDFIDGILAFIETFNANIEMDKFPKTKLDLFIEYQNFIIKTPSKEIAQILGSMPFSYNGTDDDTTEAAPKFTLADVPKYPEAKRPIMNYSMLRTPKHIQYLIKLKMQLTCIKNQLLFVHINKRKNVALFRFLGISISFKKLLWGKR